MKNDQEVIPRYPFQPTLKIGGFEGPLDLLLHLIRQSKMDIYDIQIEQITQQYFDYLRAMKSHQLEVAGDYFVMAATLMNIKSRSWKHISMLDHHKILMSQDMAVSVAILMIF